MSRLDDLLDEENLSELRNKKSMQSRTYADEPIIKRASLMKNYLPPLLEELRRVGSGYEHYNWSSPKLFCAQGKLAEDYEDDFEYSGSFSRYYPTYQLMSDVQLRGYFSWRTKTRRGDIRPTSLSFAFVYIYELLNGIGVSSPEDGFYKLTGFCEKYAAYDGSVKNYLRDWIVDYTVYYGLDPELIRGSEDMTPFRQYAVLSRYGKHTRDELFEAVCGLSSYNIKNSKFYKAYPDDTKRVICDTVTALSEHYEKDCKNTLCERYFGKTHTMPYTMFSSAVFRDTRPRDEVFCEIFPGFEYICRGGKWYRTRLDRSPAKNRRLGTLIRDIDAVMREKYGFGSPLQQTDKTKVFLAAVENAIEGLREDRRRRAAAEVNIDIEKLGGIRLRAEETREKLMTDEERGFPLPEEEEDFFPGVLPDKEDAEADADAAADGDTAADDEEAADACPVLLDDTEKLVLRCALYGIDCTEQLRSGGRMLSVVADSLNEKLFDLFGDAPVWFDGDRPAVYEDYEEELKGLIR